MKNYFPYLLIIFISWNPAIGEDMTHHNHGQIDAALFQFTPEINIEVTKDTMSGWNLHIKTENFRFAPEKANTAMVPGEGHAHLYIDGQKYARIYSHWFHIGKLSPGKHILSVTLNTNDHSEIALNGQSIKATQEVIESADNTAAKP